jgi:hypothetical protein
MMTVNIRLDDFFSSVFFFERVRKNARTKHLGARAHHVCVLSEGRRVHAFLYASRVLAQSGPIFRDPAQTELATGASTTRCHP